MLFSTVNLSKKSLYFFKYYHSLNIVATKIKYSAIKTLQKVEKTIIIYGREKNIL